MSFPYCYIAPYRKSKIHFRKFYDARNALFIYLLKIQCKPSVTCISPSHFHIIFSTWMPGIVLLTLTSGQRGAVSLEVDCSSVGMNRDTRAMFDISDFRLDLSTAWIAMKISVPFPKLPSSSSNSKVSSELASLGMRLVVFTWTEVLNLSLRSTIFVLIRMMYLEAKM